MPENARGQGSQLCFALGTTLLSLLESGLVYTFDLKRFWGELLLPATHSRARTTDDSARGRLYAITPYVSMFTFEHTRLKLDTFYCWKVACRETDSGVNIPPATK